MKKLTFKIAILLVFCWSLPVEILSQNTLDFESLNKYSSENIFKVISKTGGGRVSAITEISDLDSNGYNEWAIGIPNDDDGNNDAGAIYILFRYAGNVFGRFQKISSLKGNFNETLPALAGFGCAIEPLGDLDGNGVADIMVGASTYNKSGSVHGAVFTLFLEEDGTVRNSKRIDVDSIGMSVVLNEGADMGASIAYLGNVDEMNGPEVVIGLPGYQDFSTDEGALLLMTLESDGSMKASSEFIINGSTSNLGHTLDYNDRFGASVDVMDDYNNDGFPEILVGANGDDTYGTNAGCAYMIYLQDLSMLDTVIKISEASNDLASHLTTNDNFGYGVCNIGDINNDGISDMVAGIAQLDGSGTNEGGLAVILLDSIGDLDSVFTVSENHRVFSGLLDNSDELGRVVTAQSDQDGDGLKELLVVSMFDDDYASNRGAIYEMYLKENPDTTVYNTDSALYEIPNIEMTFQDPNKYSSLNVLNGYLTDNDQLSVVVEIGDVDGNGITDLAAGAPNGGNGGRGVIYIMMRDTNYAVSTVQEISHTSGNLGISLNAAARFGSDIVPMGNLDGQKAPDIAVGIPLFKPQSQFKGAVAFLYLDTNGTVDHTLIITDTNTNFLDTLAVSARFGEKIENIGDLDNNGVDDIAVAAPYYNNYTGSIYIILLDSNQSIDTMQVINDTTAGVPIDITNDNFLGMGIGSISDLNDDGRRELFFTLYRHNLYCADCGTAGILYLSEHGTVLDAVELTDPNLRKAIISSSTEWGVDVHIPGDLDGDGWDDILISSKSDDGGGTDRGAAYAMFMSPHLYFRGYEKIWDSTDVMIGELDNTDYFGYGLGSLADTDGDGMAEIIVVAQMDDDGGTNRGAYYTFGYEISVQQQIVDDNITYANLKDELDAGFFIAEKGILGIKYTEYYDNNEMEFVIYDRYRNEIASNQSLNSNVQYGTNRLAWDLSQLNGMTKNQYYTLEVTNSKGRTQYLRFKYVDSDADPESVPPNNVGIGFGGASFTQ